MHSRRFLPPLLVAGALLAGGCAPADEAPDATDEPFDAPADSALDPGMSTGTTGAPGPGTAGTPGAAGGPDPDTLGADTTPPR